MVNSGAIRNIIGIVGNVISFGLFLSPVPTIYNIVKKKSVQEFKVDPYIATILNCVMWVIYGLPNVNPDHMLVDTINGIGLGIEVIYVGIFLYYSMGWSRTRRTIAYGLLFEAIFTIAVVLVTFLAFHSTKDRTLIMGIICIVFNVAMYCSPLTVMKRVIQTKSVKYMPFWLSLANFLNGACWTAYASIHFDIFMVIPNSLGALSGVVQLVLYWWYYKTTDWSDLTLPTTKQVQLRTEQN